MKPIPGGFPAGGYVDYSALQRDAARRLERMEQRAREAVGSPDEVGAETPRKRQDPAESGAQAVRRQDSGADRYEQLFLLLLIYILSRERSDPYLIAALVYLLI